MERFLSFEKSVFFTLPMENSLLLGSIYQNKMKIGKTKIKFDT